ncbi:hypothetical protein UFOVP49_131 [uncultured Caudovirales phage]|uniref:Uncharacterized protein n=1 Tax=uncultured Caudovirales phage TaxID=2100421 RepID=A0A6J5KTH2_9CAUD|nr:hypothetical protein UFOVP49_131 [uncultured Caudovirales phage]
MITLKQFKVILHEVMSAGGGSVRGIGYVSGNPDGDSSNYQTINYAVADTRSDSIFKQAKDHQDLHGINKDVNAASKASKGKAISEELKVGDKDDDGKYEAQIKIGGKVNRSKKKKASKLKRKYQGKLRATTHTGKPAHPINTKPMIGVADDKRVTK